MSFNNNLIRRVDNGYEMVFCLSREVDENWVLDKLNQNYNTSELVDNLFFEGDIRQLNNTIGTSEHYNDPTSRAVFVPENKLEYFMLDAWAIGGWYLWNEEMSEWVEIYLDRREMKVKYKLQ